MKKLLFAAAVITAMASCSNNEIIDVNPGEGISFRTSLDKATRANAENVTLLSNLKEFNVTAIGDNKNYFTNLKVSSENQGTSWNTASIYYWPSFNLDFFAYAPTSINSIVSITNDAKVIKGFAPATEVSEQKDLLVSYNTGNKTQNEISGVALNFKHALSQIEIKAKCSNPNIIIKVKGIRIVNPATKGTFTFPSTPTTAESQLQQSFWGSLEGENTSAYKIKGNEIELNKTAQSLMFGNNNFMLIPQKLTAWNGTEATTGAYISVLCQIYSKTEDGQNILLYPNHSSSNIRRYASVILPEGTNTNKYAYASVPINTIWEPGKKYIYTLDFCSTTDSGGAGLIDPNPDTDDQEVDPNPKDNSKGGDPVLNGPIKFTVNVENWIDEEKEITMN